MTARLGQTVGPYRLERELGRGGMGVVYLGRQEPLGRPVAVKLQTATDPDAAARFRREWVLAAALDHPNVLPIYDAGAEDGVLFMAMRLVDGPDLGTLVAREGPLAPVRAARLVGQVGAALDAAHARGLVHRDVKPANVLVRGREEDEHAYLSDFGAGREQGRTGETPLTRPGQWLGTVGYVAPELLQGAQADGRADVYALGCVLFEALTGRPPFPRDDDAAVLWAHVHAPPPRVSDVLPVPRPALDAVIAQALAKDPARRYATGRNLARAAATAARAPTPTSAPTSRRVWRRRPVPRRRRRVLAAGLVVAAVVAAGIGWTARPDSTPVARSTGPEVAGVVVGSPIAVDGEPINLAVGAGGVWTANYPEMAVARIDPAASALDGPATPVGKGPYGIAVGFGVIWVTNADSGTVSRIDPRTRRVLGPAIRTRGLPGGVAVGAGAVWVGLGEADAVVRIDPGTLAMTRIRARGYANHVAVGFGAVWVTLPGADALGRIDPRNNAVVERIAVGDNPHDVAVGAGSVWVTARDDNALVRVDPRSNRVVDRIRVGPNPYDVAVGAGGVWVTSAQEGTVRRLDPETGRIIGRPLETGKAARDVAVGEGAVWVVNQLGRTVSRIEPSR